jgi:hypothetical protein
MEMVSKPVKLSEKRALVTGLGSLLGTAELKPWSLVTFDAVHRSYAWQSAVRLQDSTVREAAGQSITGQARALLLTVCSIRRSETILIETLQ